MTIVRATTMEHEEDRQPRYMVFQKMEQLVRQMQDGDKGIPVRCQKVFLTTIPSAFTGYDLILWLTDYLDIDDATEVLHLATQLCQHGYIFPVTDTKTLTVKDDGTLYRFQSPYFWPSQNWDPDIVEYAIYLAKRSVRNKQRHALEEYEQAAFNQIQKMLCNKWDFIYMQAEEQVRLAKDRKKAEKVVSDSQERAFWRVHRPPPGQMSSMESRVARNFNPSQMKVCKADLNTVASRKKEVEFLTRCLKQSRMKLSKVIESYAQRFEQYEEHDPFMTPPAPSNPWLSDDPALWILNTSFVETPMERRVKRWAFGLSELLSDETGLHEFQSFVESEFSSENLKFWLGVENLKRVPEAHVAAKVEEIYTEFIASGSPREINIDSKTMETTLQNLKDPSRYTYDAAQNHIFLLMKKDSYQRFLRSDQYKNLLTNAINACPKKKFTFAYFGSRKRSPVPSPKARRRGSAGSTVITTNATVAGGGLVGLGGGGVGGTGNGEKEIPLRSVSTATLSHHSYSTGNLKELDHRNTTPKGSPNGSNHDIKGMTKVESDKSLSPSSIRKRITDMLTFNAQNERRRKNSMNLEVPQQYTAYSSPDSSDNEIDLRIHVPAPHSCNPGNNNTSTKRPSSPKSPLASSSSKSDNAQRGVVTNNENASSSNHSNKHSSSTSHSTQPLSTTTTLADINVVAPWEITDI